MHSIGTYTLCKTFLIRKCSDFRVHISIAFGQFKVSWIKTEFPDFKVIELKVTNDCVTTLNSEL